MIEIHVGPNGRNLPLQRVTMLYAKNDPLSGGNLVELKSGPSIEAVFVSHFETCPSRPENRAKGDGDGVR
jgi:hypothetical protein